LNAIHCIQTLFVLEILLQRIAKVQDLILDLADMRANALTEFCGLGAKLVVGKRAELRESLISSTSGRRPWTSFSFFDPNNFSKNSNTLV
jgi:hypothetical protein